MPAGGSKHEEGRDAHMGNLTRIGFVLGAAALVLTAGCEGCNPPTPEPVVQCSDVTVSFTAPTAATVDSPFDVSIEAKAPDGTAFDFEGAKLTVDNGTPIELAVSGSTATFSAVTAAGGAHTLTVTFTKGACGPDAEEPSNKTVPATKTVTVSTPCTAKVTGVTFPQDANGDGKLNSTELPSGTDMQVRVAASCATGVQARVKNTTTSEIIGALTDISSGTATVLVPVTSDGLLNLFAELVKSGDGLNTTTSNPEALASIDIERTPPACSNTTKVLNGPNDDENMTLAAFQLNVTGAVGASALTAAFSIPGQTTQNATPTLGTASAQFTLPMTGDETYAVTLTCTDAAGNTTTDTKTVRLDFLPPAVAITSPINPDGGPALVTLSPTNIVISTDSEDGTSACATRINGATRTAVGCATVASGAATLPVSFSTDGDYGIEVESTDLAGNIGMASAAWTVQLSGCGLGFTRPIACPALITASQVSNGNYGFQTQSKTTCQGQPVDLIVRSMLADGGTGSPSLVGSGTVGATGFASILGPVASGAFLYSATVANIGVDAGVTSVDCDVTIDLDGPSITSPTASAGQTVTINALQDGAPEVEGAQRILQFFARVPSDGRVDMCTTQAVDPVSGQTRSTTAECGANYYLLNSSVTSPTPGFTFPEGTYQIKIVVIGGGTTVESAPVSLFVDVTRPCLLASSRRLPQDVNGDSRLNATELGALAPQLEFSLDPSCKDTGPTTLASTPLVVAEIVGGTPAGSFANPGDVTWTSPNFLVNLTQGISNEKDYVFFVRLTDAAGNSNTYSGINDPSTFAVRIDKVAPPCTISTPSASQTLLGASQVVAGQFGVTVETVSDVGTAGVAVTLSGSGNPQTASLTPAAPAYQASTAFTVTGTQTWTVAANCADTSGNTTAATSRTLTIDLEPPTCNLTSPTGVAPYGTNQIATSMTVSGADGRAVNCTTNGAALSPSFLVISGVANQVLTYPNGTQSVACSVSDLAGNPCTSSVGGVVVDSTACPLSLTNAVSNASGLWFNSSNTTVNGSSGTANVTANTSTCGAGKTVTLKREPSGPSVIQTTDGSGNVTFAGVTLAQGETWSVLIDNGAGVTNSQTFRVALVAPAATGVTINGPTNVVTSGVPLRFVAATGNRYVETSTAGYFADVNGSAAGAQLDLAINSVTGGRVFNLDGTVEVRFKGSVLVSQVVTTDPQTFNFSATTLPHNDSGTLEVRLLDAAGNQATVTSNSGTIDVIAPAGPSVSQSLKEARAATVTLQWSPTYDDGADSTTGANAGYDVRWTTLAVPGITTGIPDSATYFGSLVRQESVVPWSALPISHDVALPPLNTYYLAVRALDELGNYSTLTAPSALPNWGTQVLLLAPVASSAFGQSVLSAKVNNDALDDVVVSAPTKAGGGAVYVYFGSQTLTDQATCGAGCQELVPSDAVAGAFGSDIASGGNIGDVSSELKDDLVVAQTWSSAPNSGRVVIYFGSTTSTISTANSIEIRGNTSNRIGLTARIIKDINGDQLDELAIAAPLYNGNRGRVYIFRGRSQAAWAAARTETDSGSGVQYILVTSADYVVDGPFGLLVSPAGNAFGQFRRGLISVGDINADAVPDVAIPMSRPSINRYRVLSGAAIAASSPASPLLDGGTPLLELTQATTGDNGTNNGFGASAVSTDMLGATSNDLVVSFPGAASTGTVFIYGDPVAAVSQPSPLYSIKGPLTFGTQVSIGRINTGDTLQDILAGQSQAANNIAWIVYQQAGARIWDGTGTDVLGVSPQFWISKFEGATIAGSSLTTLGKSNAIGDVDGLNGNDIVLSDEGVGQVRIWR